MTRDEMNALLGATEEELDAIAAEYETDAWDESHLGKVIMGRPPLHDEAMRSITFKEYGPTIEKMDRRAADLRMSRSEYIRKLIERDLAVA